MTDSSAELHDIPNAYRWINAANLRVKMSHIHNPTPKELISVERLLENILLFHRRAVRYCQVPRGFGNSYRQLEQVLRGNRKLSYHSRGGESQMPTCTLSLSS